MHIDKIADLKPVMATGSNTVILGAGIIGLSTAYYLAQHQSPGTIHLVEASPELFASASGYAGGFLARDWFAPATASLGALSFDEHKRLAEAHDGASRWGYQPSTAVSYTVGTSMNLGGRTSRIDAAANHGNEQEGGDIAWLRRSQGDRISVIGATAQLDPRRLCQFLLDECLALGVQLHHPAQAVAVDQDMRDELACVRIAATTSKASSSASSPEVLTEIPCSRLIISAGAWSPRVFASLFPESEYTPPISSLAGYSLVVRSPRWTAEMGNAEGPGAHAVFTTSKAGFSPELFSRADGEIWLGGLNSSTMPLPGRATEKMIDIRAIEVLRKEASVLLGRGDQDDLEIIREGLCFRPVTPPGTPIISRLDDKSLGGISTRPGAEGGVFLAAGHGPWGISLSLGTGIVLAEMVQGRTLSADVTSLMVR